MSRVKVASVDPDSVDFQIPFPTLDGALRDLAILVKQDEFKASRGTAGEAATYIGIRERDGHWIIEGIRAKVGR